MVILFLLLPKVVYLPHNTMEFFDFSRELKVNEYDQLKPCTRLANVPVVYPTMHKALVLSKRLSIYIYKAKSISL